ncbi:MAG: DUF6178 family protein [Caldimicrobium sp.]
MQRETSLRAKLEEFYSLSDQELEKALSPLRFEEVFELVLSSPWDKRAKLILYSPYPEGIVRNMPPIELFFTLKASSLDLSVELLSYAKGTQIQFLFDIDCWYKDHLRADRIASWIILLFEAGEDKVLEWLTVADWEFLIALMQKFVRIHKRPDEVDLLEAYDYLPPYTLDDVYFVEFKEESLEFYFRRIIELIRETWPETYFALMESLIWELPSDVEERAFRFRNGRLADEGIPDYYIALEVYADIHPKKLSKIEPKYLPEREEEVEELKAPLYLIPYDEERELLIYKVLSLIKDPDTLSRIQRELAWLATKVILVDHPVIDEIEEVKKGIHKMWCGLNLGLEYLSEGNLEIVKEILKNHYLEEIFRVSRTALRELRKFALSLLNNKEFNVALLKYLDQPYAGYLQGATRRRLNEIQLFVPANIGTDREYVEFSRISEIRMVRRYIEEIGYMAPLLEKGLGPVSTWVKEVIQPRRNFDLNFLTWSSIILTALAQYLYSKEFVFRALPYKAWREIFPKLIESKDEKCYLREELKEGLFENFRALAKSVYYLEENLLSSFLNFVVNKFENEFRFAHPEDPPDPKYQTLILIDLSS